MLDEKRLRGVFWRPEVEDRQVPGVIEVSEEEGVRLRVSGALGDRWADLESHSVLHGVVDGGREVSLLQVFGTSRSLSGTWSEEYHVRILVMGAHTDQLESQGFRGITLEVDLLAEWSGIKTLSQKIQFTGSRKVSEITIRYAQGSAKQEHVDGVTYRLTTGCRTTGDRIHSLRLESHTHLGAQPRNHRTLTELLRDFATPFQQLVALSADYPCAVLSCRSKVRIQDGRSWRYQPVDIIYEPRFAHYPGKRKPLAAEFALRLPDVEGDFGSWLHRWIKKREELDSVLGLYFSALYGPGMLLDQHFMYYVQGLETYHRWAVGGTDLAPSLHEDRLNAVLAASPEKHKTWLKQKLSFSNELSLRRRLQGLIQLVDEVVDDLVDRRGKFVQKVLDTRNYLTHHDRRLRKKSATGEELYRVTEVVRYMLAGLLLRELGIDSRNLAEHLRRSRRYKFAAASKDFL